MKTQQIKYSEALELVKAKRPFVNPNSGFAQQLKLYEDLCNYFLNFLFIFYFKFYLIICFFINLFNSY